MRRISASWPAIDKSRMPVYHPIKDSEVVQFCLNVIFHLLPIVQFKEKERNYVRKRKEG